MSWQNSPMLTLIRLREGDLSADQGVAVREQLATDERLRHRWQQLSHALEGDSVCGVTGFEDLFVNTEAIAAFVEGSLPEKATHALETRLWESAAAIQEVWATYCALQNTVVPAGHECGAGLLAVALQHCEPAHDFSVSADAESTVEVAERTDGQELVRRAASHRQSTVRRRDWQAHTAISGIWPTKTLVGISLVTAVLTGVIVWGITLWSLDSDDAANVPRDQVQAPPSPSPPPPDISPREVAPEQPREPLPPPPDVVPQIVDDRRPEESHRPEPGPDKPVVPDRIGPAPPARPLAPRWTDVSGIVAVRTTNDRPWRGILAEPTTELTEDQLQLRTLPDGWLAAEIRGLKLVVNADSLVALSATQPAPRAARQLQLTVHSGQVAISGLQQDETLTLASGEDRWELRALKSGTAVGVVLPDARSRTLVTWDGEVAVADQQFHAGEIATWNGRAFHAKPLTETHGWRTAAPASSIDKAIAARLNRSSNLVGALTQLQNGSAAEGKLAWRYGFQLNHMAAVENAIKSRAAAPRDALLDWLLTATDDGPRTREVWRIVSARTATGAPKLQIRKWFLVAQKQARGGMPVIAELSQGLSARQPLFVRHCAIYFLRRLSNLPLTEYQPLHPTDAAVDSVRQKLRRVSNIRNRNARTRKTPRPGR